MMSVDLRNNIVFGLDEPYFIFTCHLVIIIPYKIKGATLFFYFLFPVYFTDS